MEFSTHCEFLSSTTFDGTPPETKQDFWQFSEMHCTTTDPVVVQITDGNNTVYISQSWDFGILFIAFLLVFGIFIWIAKTIFLFCFHQFVGIIKSKKFKLK